MKRMWRTQVAMLCAASLVACDPGDEALEETLDGEAELVPPGKKDDFLSLSAQEYYVEGRSAVVLDGADAAKDDAGRLQAAKRLIPYKQIAIGWFLNQYVGPKGPDATNKDYGGLESLTKNGSFEDMSIEESPKGTFSFTFRHEVGGTLDLLSRLPATSVGEGRYAFDLEVGKPTNSQMQQLETNNEWYRKSPWGTWDPSKVDASKKETLALTVWAQPRSEDAWIDTNALFADGLVTIGVHFGWDYHSEYHLKHSKDVYTWLVSQGFKSPVANYDAYGRASGPLKKTIKAAGKSVAVEVSLYWGKPGTDTDPDTDAGGVQLEDDMRESLATREVVVFSGHSGPFYGFALANWKKTDEGDLDDSEIPLLPMPSTYQVVLAEGCETYALGEAFMANPAKAGNKNVDIVTTTNFSNASTASTVRDFLRAIFDTDYQGNHKPWTYKELLKKLDGNSTWFNTMYGVHGIDDNPHLHPYANVKNLCGGCTVASDCGGEGNLCTKLNSSERVCTARCTTSDGCPNGYTCMDVASGGVITTRQCVPAALTCTKPAPAVPVVILNEVLADPPDGTKGDANKDGKRSADQDEFVEIVNTSTFGADLSGWTLSDSQAVRFTFPDGTWLRAGGAVVVFGGGKTNKLAAKGDPQLFVSKGLGLNNGGDQVRLVAADGSTIDQVTFGKEGGKDRSLVRSTDGDPKAPYIQHKGSAYSPGTRSDGTAF
ncbi:MAG: hypothetical protein AMXMBFR64_47950 [Myxococcales bacterium]